MRADPESNPADDEEEFDDLMSDEDVADYDSLVELDDPDADRIGLHDEEDDLCPA